MYIAIEGVIGVGKTSLARLLQAAFSAEVLLEVFEENPFLSDFYSDRARYAFQTQIFFLLSRLHDALADKIPRPDLIVYLRAPTDLLMRRIALRGRSYERQMERAYIEDLNRAYDDFFGGHSQSPVLVLDAETLDFVHNPADLELVIACIREKLGLGAYQAPLPLGDSSSPNDSTLSGDPTGRSRRGVVRGEGRGAGA